MSTHRLALFCSGAGTNARRLMERFAAHPTIEVVCLLSNRADAGALNHAAEFGVPSLVFQKKDFQPGGTVETFLKEHTVNCIVLAGFLWLVPEWLLGAYPQKVINVHPALLPGFGGKGMYGHFVHEAVSQAGCAETGITVHLADEEFDKGIVLMQVRVAIKPGEDPSRIEQAVRKLELKNFGLAVEMYLTGLISPLKNEEVKMKNDRLVN
jgi:phosphoribosylglycinamide formyltransferase-1